MIANKLHCGVGIRSVMEDELNHPVGSPDPSSSTAVREPLHRHRKPSVSDGREGI